MSYTDYIDPKLLILVPVLMYIGKMLADSFRIDNRKIPVILGVCGIALATLWVLATSDCGSPQKVLLGIFTALIEGILCAGAAVYGNQIYKQARKEE